MCGGWKLDQRYGTDQLTFTNACMRVMTTGRAGDWEGAMGVFEALRGRHEGVGGKEYMKVGPTRVTDRACVDQ